jgi:hypothetical protein
MPKKPRQSVGQSRKELGKGGRGIGPTAAAWRKQKSHRPKRSGENESDCRPAAAGEAREVTG